MHAHLPGHQTSSRTHLWLTSTHPSFYLGSHLVPLPWGRIQMALPCVQRSSHTALTSIHPFTSPRPPISPPLSLQTPDQSARIPNVTNLGSTQGIRVLSLPSNWSSIFLPQSTGPSPQLPQSICLTSFRCNQRRPLAFSRLLLSAVSFHSAAHQ